MAAKPVTKKEQNERAKKIKALAQGESRPIDGLIVCACPSPVHKDSGLTVVVNLIADTAHCHICGVETNVKTLIRKFEEGDDD